MTAAKEIVVGVKVACLCSFDEDLLVSKLDPLALIVDFTELTSTIPEPKREMQLVEDM